MDKELSKLPNDHNTHHFVKYIDEFEIKGLISSLAHTISQEYKGQRLIMVGVLKGCNQFLADLVREIKGVHVEVDFLKIGSVGRDEDGTGSIILEKDISWDIHEAHVLLVKDIIDAGRSMDFLKKRLLLANPKSLKVITLFDKPYKRKVSFEADFVGKKIDDQFIIGYGLDVENFGRNMRDVYFLKYPN